MLCSWALFGRVPLFFFVVSLVFFVFLFDFLIFRFFPRRNFSAATTPFLCGLSLL